MVCVILTFAYAFWGTYVHNQPANIWSIIWGKGVGLVQMIVGIISIILGIGGIVTSKGNKVKLAFSVALLASILLRMLSMI